MENVILVIHILACVVMTGLVLMQKSEGGALGIGGGGGGLMSGRGAAGALVRTTIIFGGIFFLTSLTMAALATRSDDGRTAIERSLEERNSDSTTGPTDLFDPNTPVLDETITIEPDGSSLESAAPVEDTGVIDILETEEEGASAPEQ